MTLHAKGYRMAVVSNKLQTGVDELARTFLKGVIDVAIGEQPSIPRKPEPDMVEEALRQLGISKEEAVYVGDSDVDVVFAGNAGIPCIGAAWGFRGRSELEQAGAAFIAEQAEDVKELVLHS